MKKIFFIYMAIAAIACSKGDDSGDNNNPGNNSGGNNNNCGTLNGYTLYRDSEGCYYNGTYGSKIYVDSDACTCD